MIEFSLRGIGVLGPGLADWAAARAAFGAAGEWSSQPTVVPAPARLPPAERRRAGTIVKLSLAVADQALRGVEGVDEHTLATVFTSSSGDAANCHALCEALAAPERVVSPTRFTNSVHNAAAGYWHIAAASRAASTSLCAYDASFGAGLLEAALQCTQAGAPVLLVAADVPYPEPLHRLRPLPDAFGVALLLDAAGAPGALARLRLDTAAAAPASHCDDAGLEALRSAIPAARVLPLLQAVARGAATTLVLDYLDDLPLTVELAR